MPTALERQGDFSELLNPANTGGSVAQTLYQPHNNQTKLTCPALATAANPTGQNILCPSQKAILNMYPMPNQSIFGIANQNYAYT